MLKLALIALAAGQPTPPAGFVPLFDGKSLAGWQGVVPLPEQLKASPEQLAKLVGAANAKVLPHWTVQPEGVLHYDGKGDSLQTVKHYGDFELMLEWKINKAGDSGIYVRGQPQVQIWDSENLPASLKADAGTGSGGLWNNPAGAPGKTPSAKADRPVGEWNAFVIRVAGDRVTVDLNGTRVVENALLANYWAKGRPLPTAGPIELQHHGDELWFRHIYIREYR